MSMLPSTGISDILAGSRCGSDLAGMATLSVNVLVILGIDITQEHTYYMDSF